MSEVERAKAKLASARKVLCDCIESGTAGAIAAAINDLVRAAQAETHAEINTKLQEVFPQLSFKEVSGHG